MEEKEGVQQARTRKGPRKQKHRKRYTHEQKLKAVKLHLEEGFKVDAVCQEMGMCQDRLYRWVRKYREEGEAGLMSNHPPRGVILPAVVQQKIVELKQANPWWGVKRIALVMKRWFLLPASPSTVRKTLAAQSLMDPPNGKKQRNPGKPRSFERATPNQMWQTDIFTFRLGGRYAHLVAFMDDYSRFIVSAGLFRSATGTGVLEVFRRGAGEYNPPKEMLTDRGPQYVNWRGKSRFAAEMEKEKIHHIKSRAGHPQTLGKVERFWSSIWQEFLVRAQFESFESAQERIARWIQYYNHKRPHQGIEGLCPADRYFEIAHEVRKTIEAGIHENVLELALRGEPRAPFYMVGRMEGQSVVLRAEKGKLKLTVEDAQQNQTKELVYELKKGEEHDNNHGKAAAQAAGANPSQCNGQMPGGAEPLDGESLAGRFVPGAEGQLHGAQSLAGAGAGRDAPGVEHAGGPAAGTNPLAATANVAGETPASGGSAEVGTTAGEAAGGNSSGSKNGELNQAHEKSNEPGSGVPSTPAVGLTGAGRDQNGQGGGAGAGNLAPSVPPMGEAGPSCPASGDGGAGTGEASHTGKSGDGSVAGGVAAVEAQPGSNGGNRGIEGIALAPVGGGSGAGGTGSV